MKTPTPSPAPAPSERASDLVAELAAYFEGSENWKSWEIAAALQQHEGLRLATRVADTLIARRDVEREVLSGKVQPLATDTPYWNDLMRRERDARVANDAAVAEYRRFLSERTAPNA